MKTRSKEKRMKQNIRDYQYFSALFSFRRTNYVSELSKNRSFSSSLALFVDGVTQKTKRVEHSNVLIRCERVKLSHHLCTAKVFLVFFFSWRTIEYKYFVVVPLKHLNLKSNTIKMQTIKDVANTASEKIKGKFWKFVNFRFDFDRFAHFFRNVQWTFVRRTQRSSKKWQSFCWKSTWSWNRCC